MNQQQLIDDLMQCTDELDGLLTKLQWLIEILLPDPDDDDPPTLDKEAREAFKRDIGRLTNCQEAIETVLAQQWEILSAARVANDLRRIA